MSDYEALKQEIQELKTITLISSKDVLTTEEAAYFLGLSKSYVYKLCQNLLIVHYRSQGGKNIYIKKEDLMNWMLNERCKTIGEIKAEVRRKA